MLPDPARRWARSEHVPSRSTLLAPSRWLTLQVPAHLPQHPTPLVGGAHRAGDQACPEGCICPLAPRCSGRHRSGLPHPSPCLPPCELPSTWAGLGHPGTSVTAARDPRRDAPPRVQRQWLQAQGFRPPLLPSTVAGLAADPSGVAFSAGSAPSLLLRPRPPATAGIWPAVSSRQPPAPAPAPAAWSRDRALRPPLGPLAFAPAPACTPLALAPASACDWPDLSRREGLPAEALALASGVRRSPAGPFLYLADPPRPRPDSELRVHAVGKKFQAWRTAGQAQLPVTAGWRLRLRVSSAPTVAAQVMGRLCNRYAAPHHSGCQRRLRGSMLEANPLNLIWLRPAEGT